MASREEETMINALMDTINNMSSVLHISQSKIRALQKLVVSLHFLSFFLSFFWSDLKEHGDKQVNEN